MKRTNLVLDEHLLAELTRVSGERTYSGAVTKAMEAYLRRHKAGRILELACSSLWEGDLSEMRLGSRAGRRSCSWWIPLSGLRSSGDRADSSSDPWPTCCLCLGEEMAEEVLSLFSMHVTITVDGEVSHRIERFSRERAASFEGLADQALRRVSRACSLSRKRMSKRLGAKRSWLA
jgi:Arc/MetJ family transcription regulator